MASCVRLKKTKSAGTQREHFIEQDICQSQECSEDFSQATFLENKI